MKVKPSLLLNASLHYATPISITEVFCLAANVKLFKTTLASNQLSQPSAACKEQCDALPQGTQVIYILLPIASKI